MAVFALGNPDRHVLVATRVRPTRTLLLQMIGRSLHTVCITTHCFPPLSCIISIVQACTCNFPPFVTRCPFGDRQWQGESPMATMATPSHCYTGHIVRGVPPWINTLLGLFRAQFSRWFWFKDWWHCLKHSTRQICSSNSKWESPINWLQLKTNILRHIQSKTIKLLLSYYIPKHHKSQFLFVIDEIWFSMRWNNSSHLVLSWWSKETAMMINFVLDFSSQTFLAH